MNQHGYCPHCGADFDGEKILDTFKNKGYTDDTALAMASNYAGFKEYGVDNKWDNRIYVTDYSEDYSRKLKYYKCSSCDKRVT